MTDEAKKRRTDKELMLAVSNGSTDDLSVEEMTRYSVLLDLEHKRLEQLDLKDRVNDRKNKRDMRFQEFKSRGLSLTQTDKVNKQRQDGCSHRKGGRGLEALQKGGSDSDFAVIRHLMPNNCWWQRCQRCGKTWKPPAKQDFKLETVEGKSAYDQAVREYKEALSWPSDNIPSTGITFQHKSDDGDKSADEFLYEAYKDVNLR
jgi:hypothetical protein